MNVTCPECQSIFRVDPAKVPATGLRARCSVCGGIIVIIGGTMPTTVTPNGNALVTPHQSVARPLETPAPAHAYNAAPAFSTATSATSAPGYVPASGNATAVAATSTPKPAPAQYATPDVQAAHASVSSHTPSASLASSQPSAPRKPINPFLSADPGLRARRLARALVSDLVAYHPQKRDEGLKNGTLRQLFRDEIKKSHEEFVEQVGQELADSTTHFQEALNEILASGHKLF